MKKIVDDWRLIYKVCSLYYEDDMRQQEISDYLGIFRATISRMLQKEKEINFKDSTKEQQECPQSRLRRSETELVLCRWSRKSESS